MEQRTSFSDSRAARADQPVSCGSQPHGSPDDRMNSTPLPWTFDRAGAAIPRFLYGTAWKEDDTERCTAAALAAGFRGIDTANQRKHYHEAGVGAAVASALASGR